MLESLFGKSEERTPSQKVADLRGESMAIVGLITNTITDLQRVNGELIEQKEALSEEINRLVSVRDNAGRQEDENTIIARNLESLLKS